MTDSIRTLGLIDLPVLALHSRRVYPNQAVTFEHGQASHGLRPGPLRLLRACLLPGHQRQIWVARDGATLLGVAALRRRGGRSAWEIDTLITTAPTRHSSWICSTAPSPPPAPTAPTGSSFASPQQAPPWSRRGVTASSS